MISPQPIPTPVLGAESENTSTPAGAAPDSGFATTSTAMAARRITSDALLGDATELLIEHGDTVYRLRRTATGKLILTK